MNQTVNKEKKVVYVASKFTTGLSDLTLTVRKPDGTVLSPNPSAIEQGDGVYIFTYTPDIVGRWQEKLSSVINGDKVFRSYEVVAYDASDLQTQIADVDTKIDGVQSTVTVTDGKVDVIDTKIDAVDTKLITIDSKIDNIAVEIHPGGYFA
jgi:hypothetical protein